MKKYKRFALLALALLSRILVTAQEPPRIEILNQDCIERAFKKVFTTSKQYDSATVYSFTLTALLRANGTLKNFEMHQCDSPSIVFRKKKQLIRYLTNCFRIRLPDPIKNRIIVKKQKLYIEMLINRGRLYDFEDIPFQRNDVTM